MKNLRVIFALVIFVFLSHAGIVAQDTTAPAKNDTPSVADFMADGKEKEGYRIGFQDVLDIQVFRHADLSQRVAVSPTGMISLFRLDKPIVAVCKTERELANELEKAYLAKYIRDPQVKVYIAEQRSQAVAVIGAVEKPGNYFVNRRMHLLAMLAMAGGPSKESGTRLLVARTGSTTSCRQADDVSLGDQVAVVNFKIRDIQEGKESFWLKPGDVVSVSDADVVYIYGDVVEPGSLRIREPITLTQAIATSKGLRPAAQKDKIRILRQRAGAVEREEMVFDMSQIDKGMVKDPILEPNDIVAISRDKSKAIMIGVVDMIKGTVPNALIYR